MTNIVRFNWVDKDTPPTPEELKTFSNYINELCDYDGKSAYFGMLGRLDQFIDHYERLNVEIDKIKEVVKVANWILENKNYTQYLKDDALENACNKYLENSFFPF